MEKYIKTKRILVGEYNERKSYSTMCNDGLIYKFPTFPTCIGEEIVNISDKCSEETPLHQSHVYCDAFKNAPKLEIGAKFFYKEDSDL